MPNIWLLLGIIGALTVALSLEDEADKSRVLMPEFDRPSGCIEWTDFSLWSASGLLSGRFKWASGVSCQHVNEKCKSVFIGFGVEHSYVAVHN